MNHIFQTSLLLIHDKEPIIDCVNMWNGQKQPSSHSCTELSKSQYFPVIIVKHLKMHSKVWDNF